MAPLPAQVAPASCWRAFPLLLAVTQPHNPVLALHGVRKTEGLYIGD